jgi:hypothetical protein
MSKHCHHSCEHKEVKFCKDCNKVYCAGCKEEWEAPCRQSHYPWTLQQGARTFPCEISWTSDKTSVSLQPQQSPRDPAFVSQTATCAHL